MPRAKPPFKIGRVDARAKSSPQTMPQGRSPLGDFVMANLDPARRQVANHINPHLSLLPFEHRTQGQKSSCPTRCTNPPGLRWARPPRGRSGRGVQIRQSASVPVRIVSRIGRVGCHGNGGACSDRKPTAVTGTPVQNRPVDDSSIPADPENRILIPHIPNLESSKIHIPPIKHGFRAL